MPEPSPLPRACPRSPIRPQSRCARRGRGCCSASRCWPCSTSSGVDEGAASIVPGHYVHEWVHDGRHLLGFPCH